MRVLIVVKDEDGNTFDGEVTLRPTRAKKSARRKAEAEPAALQKLDFSEPIRPFINRNAKGLTGQAKFALLLAHMTAGKIDQVKELSDIKNTWNKMKELMGGSFNTAYTIRARNNGWVHTPRFGSYVLRPSWQEALGSK